jgi:hypothetical protein
MFAWQGWIISLPDGWNPMKLEGDFDAGYALIADVFRPRLGIRWGTPGRRFEPLAWAKRALVAEVGSLAADAAEACEADHWKGALLFTEPELPGRDVWVAWGNVSGRTIELVHHVRDGELSKMEELRRNLADSQPTGELAWAVFDLSCRTPPDWRLDSMVLNAGDMRLTFMNERQRCSVRQLAVAQLALKRMSLDQWLTQEQRTHERNYRAAVPAEPVHLNPDGLRGLSCRMQRRGGLWRKRLAPEIHMLALEDGRHDKLLLLTAETKASVENLARTVGWAAS